MPSTVHNFYAFDDEGQVVRYTCRTGHCIVGWFSDSDDDPGVPRLCVQEEKKRVPEGLERDYFVRVLRQYFPKAQRRA
jgi:hypothetical protein